MKTILIVTVVSLFFTAISAYFFYKKEAVKEKCDKPIGFNVGSRAFNVGSEFYGGCPKRDAALGKYFLDAGVLIFDIENSKLIPIDTWSSFSDEIKRSFIKIRLDDRGLSRTVSESLLSYESQGFKAVESDVDGLNKFSHAVESHIEVYFYQGAGDVNPVLVRCTKIFENIEGHCQSVVYADSLKGFTVNLSFYKPNLFNWKKLYKDIESLIEEISCGEFK